MLAMSGVSVCGMLGTLRVRRSARVVTLGIGVGMAEGGMR